jgi:hypothetical protein
VVEEQLLRLGRRGVEYGPFCIEARIHNRAYSRRLQRVMVDSGAESAFGWAAARARDHYPESRCRSAAFEFRLSITPHKSEAPQKK